METVALAAAAALLGAVGGFLVRRPKAVLMDTTVPGEVPRKHVHQATYFNTGGWHCDCGAHRHVYIFPDGNKKRCTCGKTGVEKEWA